MYDWDDAVEETRHELGYNDGDYISDWDWFLDKVKETYDYYKEEEKIKHSIECDIRHKEHLKSGWWKNIRTIILSRDGCKCIDCFGDATEVHHLHYDNLGILAEISDCVSLCRKCHQRRHENGR